MKQSKDAESPATASLAYNAMLPAWTKIQAVLDGTEAMRAAGQVYLPQHYGETDDAYLERKHRATLLNISKMTLSSWVGRPFSDPLRFQDTPANIEDMLSNIDLVGTDAQVFCRDWFYDGVAKAYSHVYVDFPRTDQAEGVRTVADDTEEGVRPYWVHLRPEQVFFADSEVVDGREVLREIRIMEELIERDGFAEVVVPQIRRVFVDETGSHVQLYQRKEPEKDDSPWVVVDQYDFSLGFIPLVTFYSSREAFMIGKPPLEDLVDLNIAHWQGTSDQRAILTVTRFPILALSGGSDEGKKLTIGPNQWLYSPDPQSKFYYVEHSGKAIEAGRQDLVDLEEQMAQYGADFLRKRPGNTTATARALDSAEATSPLQDMTLRFKEAVDQALDYTAQWEKVAEGGTVLISTDFGPEDVNQAELNTLRETRKMRDLSRASYLEELKRRGLLNDEFDIDEDAELLEQEALDMFGTAPDETKEDDDGMPEGTDEGTEGQEGEAQEQEEMT